MGHIDDKRPRGYWTLRRINEIAADYTSRVNFKKDYPSAYRLAASKGIVDLIAIPYTNVRWDLDKAKEEAKKYSSWKDFKKHCSGGYFFIQTTGIKHIAAPHLKNSTRIWSYEKCLADARNYSSLKEWRTKNMKAEKASRRHGWNEAITSEVFKNK